MACACLLSIPPFLRPNSLTLCLMVYQWNCRDGKFVREIAYLPLAEDIPVAFNSCRKGPRSIGWRDDKPAELYWAEAQVRRSPGLVCTADTPEAVTCTAVVCKIVCYLGQGH